MELTKDKAPGSGTAHDSWAGFSCCVA